MPVYRVYKHTKKLVRDKKHMVSVEHDDVTLEPGDMTWITTWRDSKKGCEGPSLWREVVAVIAEMSDDPLDEDVNDGVRYSLFVRPEKMVPVTEGE